MYGRMVGWMAMELIVGVFRVGNKSIEFIDLICDIQEEYVETEQQHGSRGPSRGDGSAK